MFFRRISFVCILVLNLSVIVSARLENECPCGKEICTSKIHPHVNVQLKCAHYVIITCLDGIEVNSTVTIPRTSKYEKTVAVIDFKTQPQLEIDEGYDKTLFLIGQNFPYNRMFFRSMDLHMLSLNFPDLTELPDDLFADINNLTMLEITNTKLEKFKGAISRLTNLTTLDIALSSLSRLEQRTFENSNNLRKLSLWRNQLSYLDKDDFLGLDFLVSLELFGNQIQSIHADAFRPLVNLRYIGLKENKIKIEEGFFRYCVRLTVAAPSPLDWPDNEKEYIPHVHALIKNYQNLNVLTLSNSSEIRIISYVGNKLRKLQLSVKPPFGRFRALLSISLTNNEIAELPGEVFYNCRRLRYLNIDYNQIQHIPKNLFRDLTNLKELHMRNNRLKTIHTEAFRGLIQVSKLILSHNQLQLNMSAAGQTPFRYLSAIEYVDLNHNQITSLENTLWEGNTSLVVNITNNRISKLRPKDIPYKHYNNLSINLKSNNIRIIDFHDIEPDYFAIVTVHLDDKSILCDCKLGNWVELVKQVTFRTPVGHYRIPDVNPFCADSMNLPVLAGGTIDYSQLECELSKKDLGFEKCPEMCLCFKRTVDKALIINCSNAGLRYVPKLPVASALNLTHTILYLDYNLIGELPKEINAGLLEVSEIHARGNLLRNIISGDIPKNIHLLDLRWNLIETISDEEIKKIDESNIIQFYFGRNNWNCDCSEQNGVLFLSRISKKIVDYKELKCNTGQLISSIPPELFESCSNRHMWPLAILIFLLIICFSAAIILYYKNEQKIKIWMYWHNILPCIFDRGVLDHNKKYDAFISFSHRDVKFVADELIPELEGKRKLNLCIHMRDWIPGDFIPEQIVRSVSDSRRTLIVLSENFIKSVWGIMEFRTAHRSAMEDQVSRVIIILYGELDRESLDPELKAYIDMNTYIDWGDSWFFERLHYAMKTVHVTKKRKTRETRISSETLAVEETRI